MDYEIHLCLIKISNTLCGISYENLAKSPFMKLLINFFNFESSNLILSDEQKKIDTFRQNFVGIDV